MSASCFEYITGANAQPSREAVLDVVFVHGLTGDHLQTWTHANGEFWPRWLATDYPSINVYSAGYESSFFSNILKGDGASLVDRATMLIDRLLSRQLPGRKMLFIAHSLGGLITKQVLRRSSDASSHSRKALCSNVAGVVFLGTPHSGTFFAKAIKAVLSVASSRSVKELAHGADALLDLGQWFSTWAAQRQLRVDAYYEIEHSNGVLVVDQVTANPNVLGCDPVALQANHIDMAKLENRDTQLYQSLSCVLADIIDQIATAPSDKTADGEIVGEYNIYTAHADDDRRNLAQKLTDADRAHSIRWGERQKEKFSKILHRSIAQPSAVRRNTRLMASIETRHHRHVGPAIAAGQSIQEIDAIIQTSVLDPTLQANTPEWDDLTAGTVDSAFYYLAGNCHIGWDS